MHDDNSKSGAKATKKNCWEPDLYIMYRGAKAHLAINHSEATVPVLLHGIISLLNSDKDNRNITVKVSKSTTFSDDEFKLDLDNFKVVRTLFSLQFTQCLKMSQKVSFLHRSEDMFIVN